MITDIEITGSDFSEYNLEELNGIGKVNIFIGSNNSGKSRLLRKFFSNKNIPVLVKDFDSVSLVLAYNSLIDEIGKIKEPLTGIDNSDDIHLSSFFRIFNTVKYSKYPKYKKFDQIDFENIYELISHIRAHLKYSGKTNYRWGNTTTYLILEVIRDILNEYENRINEIINSYKKDIYNYINIYIPILRGLLPLYEASPEYDIYKARVIRDYFDNNNSFEIFTGLNLYKETRELLLGYSNDREKVKKFEQFLSLNFFNSNK